MKTKLTILALLISIVAIAQNGINYKAIIKDNNGNVVANDLIQVQFSILQGVAQSNVYQETHTPTTDANGLIILNIGEGTTPDDFNSINWSNDDHFLNVQVNIGSGLVDLGTTQFMHVPYALQAEKAANVTGLEAINEGNGIGWRLVGRDVNNYGVIGIDAIDFSESQVSGNTFGATGDRSMAIGVNTTASGLNSFASGIATESSGAISISMGSTSTASGDLSMAIGQTSIASGYSSRAMGLANEASGNHSTAIGNTNIASGVNSIALGLNTLASAEQAIAMGRSTTASGNHSTAIGNTNIASGDSSTALGRNNIANSTNAIAMGYETTASGYTSTAIGRGTEASSNDTFASGYQTVASAPHSTAMGFQTAASGLTSIAIGRSTEASGYYSTAMGFGTIADSYVCTSIGRYNAIAPGQNATGWSISDPLFQIGKGTSDNERSNALTVFKTGRMRINSASDGLEIIAEGGNGVFVTSGSINGVLVSGANRYGGSFEGDDAAIYAKADIYANPDIILGGNSNANSNDDGILTSDPSYPSSDLYFRSNDGVIIELDDDDNESGSFIVRNGDNNGVFSVDESGTIRQNGSTIHSSDRRLKKDIENLEYGLNEILQLKPKQYFWKNRDNQEFKSLGLIAQDVQLIIQNIVLQGDDDLKTLGVSYTELIPVLIKAIQEQQEIIDKQNNTINNQKEINAKQDNQYKALLSRIQHLEAKNSN